MLDLIKLLQNPSVYDFIALRLQNTQQRIISKKDLSLFHLTDSEEISLREYLDILPKIQRKFGDIIIATDKLALEQASNSLISLYKASEIDDPVVYDLCCGIGGDSLFLNDSIEVHGVDLDQQRLAAFKYNQNLLRPESSIQISQADINSLEPKAGVFLLDPDRRHSDSKNNWGLKQLSPSIEEINLIVNKFRHGLIKLSPATDTTLFEFSFSKEFIGFPKSVNELSLKIGKFQEDYTLTTQIQPFYQTKHLDSEINILRSSIKTSNILKAFIIEPNALSLASKVYWKILASTDCSVLNPNIPYFNSDSMVVHPFMTNFIVLDELKFKIKKLSSYISSHEYTQVEVKKRGVLVDPNELQKNLKRFCVKRDKENVLTLFLYPDNLNSKKIRVIASQRIK